MHLYITVYLLSLLNMYAVNVLGKVYDGNYGPDGLDMGGPVNKRLCVSIIAHTLVTLVRNTCRLLQRATVIRGHIGHGYKMAADR